MSRHNRERRKWRCRGCGAGMHPELAGPAATAAARAAAAGRVRPDAPIVHVCGACKACHYWEGGRLRRLTPAEMLDLYVHLPRTMAAIEGSAFPTTDGAPAGTLVIPDPDRA